MFFVVVCSALILRLSLQNECVHTDLMNQVQITYTTVTVIAVLSRKNKGKRNASQDSMDCFTNPGHGGSRDRKRGLDVQKW